MTVLENLEMGAYLRPKADLKEDFERVYGLFPLLYERRKQLAGTLSGGEQQMLAMGRALMSKPKLLLMDEPSMGLAPILVERSFEIIKQVHEAGVAMLVVEQNANVSLSIADRGYVLSTGRVVLEGKARRPARERGPAQGLPWPCERRGVGVHERPATFAAASRSSATRSTSTPARRARSRTPCARRTRSTSTAGTRTGPSGSTGSSARRRRAAASPSCSRACRTTSRSRPPSPPPSARSSARSDFRGERNRIVISENEFPTIGQIAHAQELRGAEVVQVEPSPRRTRPRSTSGRRSSARPSSPSAQARCTTSRRSARSRASTAR